ncbi:MAG: ABC transporter permease [Elusimicrobia bacterium]|nr:ABC transporter permease [Elusimicrobiota bacterium]
MDQGRLPAFWRLLRELTWVEFKLREQGTVLGFLWTLLYPLLMFIVLYLLFVRWLGKFVDMYAAYLLIGIVLWNFFQRTTCLALTSFSRRRSLIKNYKFPREIILFSTIGSTLIPFVVELVLLLGFVLAFRVEPKLTWLFLPAVIAVQIVFVTGVSFFLPLIAAEYRDIERIWEVLTMALFYVTPVFYPLSIISEGKRTLLLYNPITQILIAARGCLIDGTIPLWPSFAVPLLEGLLLCAAGYYLMRRYEYHLVDRMMEP